MKKYIKITSIEDANDMFEALCEEVILTDSISAKRNLLGMSGKDSTVDKHKVTINQLLAVIVRLELSMELKVSYIEKTQEDIVEAVVAPVELAPEMKVDHTEKEMAGQEKEILKQQKIAEITKRNAEQQQKKVEEMPDAPDFMA